MAALNQDDNQVPTSAEYTNPASPAPSASEWAHWSMIADGGSVTFGKKADAASTNAASTTSTFMSFVKGIITHLASIITALGTGAGGMFRAEDAVHTSGDPVHPAGAVRQDTAGTGIGANGDYTNLYVNSTGRLRIIGKDEETDATNAVTTALATTLSVKASAGKLWGFTGYIDAGGTAGYVQVHDKASAVSAAEVPKISFPVVAGQPFSVDFGRKGRAFASGIQIVFSSTGVTYTAHTAHMWVDAQYD